MNSGKTSPRNPSPPRTRIQRRNHQMILDAALEVFSAKGFRGARVDEIAQVAGLSKPNLLYYFPTKEAMHSALLSGLLDTWLDPLRAMDPDGEPIEEILSYVRRKLEMSQQMPRESRLFANEILQGGAQLGDTLRGVLKPLVDEKAAVIRHWSEQGRIADVHPYHLIFSIWSLTQHYADFDIQVRTVLGNDDRDPFPEAERHLVAMFSRTLAP